VSSSTKLPVWNEKYEKLGVTAHELYMRQSGLCHLKSAVGPEGDVVIWCTDNKDSAVTAKMLNPTIECIQCIVRFTTAVMEYETKKDK